MIDFGRLSVLGVKVSAVDYEAAVETVAEAAREHRPLTCTALAVHGVMTGVRDQEHMYRLNCFDLVVPDGQPVRWALRWLHGVHLPERVYGPRLMLELCSAARDAGIPVYLFGSSRTVLNQLASNLLERFPGLVIAGRTASRFRTLTEEEADRLVSMIQASGAKLVFVGLGCPRQEVWAYEFAPRLGIPVAAVGAAFDFHAGNLPQAPAWMQRWGLEWLFRLFCEPRRLWRRYLLLNPEFMLRVIGQLLRPESPDRSHPPNSDVLHG